MFTLPQDYFGVDQTFRDNVSTCLFGFISLSCADKGPEDLFLITHFCAPNVRHLFIPISVWDYLEYLKSASNSISTKSSYSPPKVTSCDSIRSLIKPLCVYTS